MAYEMCGRDWSSDVCSSDLPIITRANRIYRIFTVGKKHAAKPRFIESKYQMTIVGIIILMQVTYKQASLLS